MSLTRTAPTVGSGGNISAESHRELLLAMDELIGARFNNRSWLIFTCVPQLELGDVFIFGTPDNLSIGGAAYDPADETPPNPTSPDVVSTDTVTQVIWLTGYSDTLTLNRRTVDYDPGTGTETWFVGTVLPQRFEPLRIADICVEDYTDPVAGVNTTFTMRLHWDKYGCVRVHNGNRFTLTLAFEGGGQDDIEIPAYGIVTLRREIADYIFEQDSYYLPLTIGSDDETEWSDPITWTKASDGQTAGSMEVLTDLVSGLSDWCRFAPVLDVDTTASEKAYFTGSDPVGTDYALDWLIHKGKLLSVVLDRRDGATTVQELTWNGLASVPDASWSGIVDFDVYLTAWLRFQSAVTPPSGAGPTEWEHDLIPISTNLTGGQILPLVPSSYLYGPLGGGDSAAPYTDPLPLGERASTATTVYSTKYGGTTAIRYSHYLDEPAVTSVDLDIDLETYAPDLGGTGAWVKCFGASGRWEETTTSATIGMSVFSTDLLARADTSGALLKWLTVRLGTYSPRFRFLAGEPRKYMAAGEESGGSAVYDYHPQEKDIYGTPDGQGGPVTVDLKTISTSQIAIEGAAWTRTATDRGADVFVPTDLLHVVAENIATPGWWATNRDRILAGTFEVEEQLMTWRPPRQTAQWNALANAMNAVQEVYRADIRYLHRDPLPDDINHPPWSYSGENPFAVPAGWVCGRYDDDDGRLDAWGVTWGITIQADVPDVATLEAIDRTWWGQDKNTAGEIVGLSQYLDSTYNVTDDLEVVNGYTFHFWKFWSKDASRHLFGGAGATDLYRWLHYDDAAAVFDLLGVAVPPPPAGERYDPVIETDSSVTQLTGTLGTGSVSFTTPINYVAQTAYRSPSSTGTWIQVWDGELSGIRYVGFRIIDSVTSQKMRIQLKPGLSGTEDWAVFEREASSACIGNWETSVRRKTVFNSAQTHSDSGAYFAIEDNVWRSGVEIYSTTPVLVIAAPELWTDFAWDSPIDATWSENPSEQYTIYENPWTTGGLRHAEFDAGTITPASLRTEGWNTHGAYHCQIVQRTGVLRA